MSNNTPIPVMVKNHDLWSSPHFRPISLHLERFQQDRWNQAPSNCPVICHINELEDEEIIILHDKGHPLVVDNLWDNHENEISTNLSILELKFDRFFWIHEYLWTTLHEIDSIQATSDYSFSAFMPIYRQRPFRDYVIEQFDRLLPDMIWSYKDRRLPHDLLLDYVPDRHVDRRWYDSTCFSVAVETIMDSKASWPICSEKTFKPIIFGHPFLIIGCKGSLAQLKSWGFETFDNMFDESYDVIGDWKERVCRVRDCVLARARMPWDAETKRRIDHNRSWFFDGQKIQQMIMDHMIRPLQELYETR